jgi:hypothetical protein
MDTCNKDFYSFARIARRACGWLTGRRDPLVALVANLSNKNNARLYRKVFREFAASQEGRGNWSPSLETAGAPREPSPRLAPHRIEERGKVATGRR